MLKLPSSVINPEEVALYCDEEVASLFEVEGGVVLQIRVDATRDDFWESDSWTSSLPLLREEIL